MTDAEYGAIVCDAIYRLAIGPEHKGSHIAGLVVNGMTLWSRQFHALGLIPKHHAVNLGDGASIIPSKYGPVSRAAIFVRQKTEIPDLTTAIPHGFTWEDRHQELMEKAKQKAALIYDCEQWLARQKKHYPHVMSLAGGVIAAIFTGFIGYCFGKMK